MPTLAFGIMVDLKMWTDLKVLCSHLVTAFRRHEKGNSVTPGFPFSVLLFAVDLPGTGSLDYVIGRGTGDQALEQVARRRRACGRTAGGHVQVPPPPCRLIFLAGARRYISTAHYPRSQSKVTPSTLSISPKRRRVLCNAGVNNNIQIG